MLKKHKPLKFKKFKEYFLKFLNELVFLKKLRKKLNIFGKISIFDRFLDQENKK